MLLFFFIIAMFTNVRVQEGTFLDKALVGILFGIFMALVPSILKFFKLPVNGGSLFIMGLVMSFVFYFVSIYFFDLLDVSRSVFNLGISFIPEINLEDRTVAMVFLSFVSAIMSIGLEMLSKNK